MRTARLNAVFDGFGESCAPVVIAVPPASVFALVELPAKNCVVTRSTPPKSGFDPTSAEAASFAVVKNCGVSEFWKLNPPLMKPTNDVPVLAKFAFDGPLAPPKLTAGCGFWLSMKIGEATVLPKLPPKPAGWPAAFRIAVLPVPACVPITTSVPPPMYWPCGLKAGATPAFGDV